MREEKAEKEALLLFLLHGDSAEKRSEVYKAVLFPGLHERAARARRGGGGGRRAAGAPV